MPPTVCNPYNTDFFFKSMETKGFFQFEIIINVLVSFFRFIWIHMSWVYGHYNVLFFQLVDRR